MMGMSPPIPIKQRLAQPDNIALVRQLLGVKPAPTRSHLTQQLCRRLDLRDPKGDWQVATTAKALRELEAENSKLKRIVADQVLDMSAMKELLGKHW